MYPIGYIISMLGHFKIIFNKCPKKEITFHRGLGTITKCRIFPKLKTYLTKAKHSSFSFTILTNLIAINTLIVITRAVFK